jgi:hypothetical protein
MSDDTPLMRSVESELREQLVRTFDQATFPVGDPTELIPVLPDGPGTEFRAGDVVIPAVELGTKYGEYQDFPYETVDALVDDIIAGLKAEDVI